MTPRFELFRLSLLRRDQIDLFDHLQNYSREEWLRKVFLEAQPFESRGSQFHFQPSQENSDELVIIGRVGRNVLREENKPPKEGFQEYTRDTWRASLIVLDPKSHNDGQKLAVQRVTDVGKPMSLVTNLIKTINSRYSSSPYTIQVAPIVETSTFWDYVEKNHQNVTTISFNFIVPNMFDSSDEIDKELRNWRDSEKADSVEVKLRNQDGLNPNTEKVREGVLYVEKGGGSIRARARGDSSYNSSESVKVSQLKEIRLKGSKLLEAAKELRERILGRSDE